MTYLHVEKGYFSFSFLSVTARWSIFGSNKVNSQNFKILQTLWSRLEVSARLVPGPAGQPFCCPTGRGSFVASGYPFGLGDSPAPGLVIGSNPDGGAGCAAATNGPESPRWVPPDGIGVTSGRTARWRGGLRGYSPIGGAVSGLQRALSAPLYKAVSRPFASLFE